jgi:hypothetical protein
LGDEEYKEMVPNDWDHVNSGNYGTNMFQFCESLKKIKILIKEWVKEKVNSSHGFGGSGIP